MKNDDLIKYQWIKGDNIGAIVTFKEEVEEQGINWVYFTNGKRIKSDLISEFLMIADNNTPIIIEEDLKPDPITTLNKTVKKEIKEDVSLQVTIESPIKSLIKKQSIKNIETIQLEINISIPNKDIYTIIRDSYTTEEVDKELYEFVLEQLASESIKTQLKDSAISIINKYYSIKINNNGK